MFDWAHPTMLAPMEGVSHPLFRSLIAECGGVGVVCTEFVRVSRAPLIPSRLRAEVVSVPGIPLSVQVMGNHADKMADAAALISAAGASVVDINLGCPTPRAARKGVGTAMLKDPHLLSEVLSAMRQATPGLFSAKIRAGFDDADTFIEIAKRVEASGADFITVHPRRRCDFYDGLADWRIIGAIKAALTIPVVGNGDIWYARDALSMEDMTGCDAVMIGRPALRNPWIFDQLASLRDGTKPFTPTGEDVVRYVSHVARAYHLRFGPGSMGRIKEMWRYMGRAIQSEEDLTREGLRMPDLDSFLSYLQHKVEGLPASRIDLDAEGALGFAKSRTKHGTLAQPRTNE